ncbi:helix-turn-helix transcriptional regulator [Pedobacter sp. HDW13]|uniref:helix-turn-helix domain-containing protein n=1 Tax=unclassified Pedobacter TaxID=2628915 RepID=UPI000F595E3F|nr:MULTISPECIES: helix-turn-helix transcriptional regulator [unclassified Pedobacter]QIL42447.1 helix-turn-helix transcriptional regulator [Pedobacter sp. HDW13]RQO78927.1 transcriptional regulator [Pedobacter sp. KBW01]
MSNQIKSIGDNIKQCRHSLNLSQADAAKKLNISTPAFCKIETGQTDLNISRLQQISKVFKVPVAQLLGLSAALDTAGELAMLKKELMEKDEEINKLRKKVIDLYDKLGM